MEFQAKWIRTSEDTGGVCPVFRKEWKTEKEVERATLYLTALGVYEAHLNGKRVGNYVLAPGWTAYDKRLQYQEYDITDLVVEENELIVTLGKGWFRSPMPGWQDTPDKLQRMGRPGGILGEVHIVYMDGSEEVIVTDQSWTWGESRVRFSEIYDGEFCDATFVTKEWNTVKEFAWSKEILIPQEGEEIREQEVVAAKSVFRTPAGELVVDFGQEITGYVEFTVDAHAGDRIHILHGEVLDAEGNFYNANYRSAKAEINYICSEGTQTWHPALTFFGFRYLLLDEFPGEATPEQFRGIAVYSNIRKTGEIRTSDPALNQLISNIFWGQRGNFLDVPTDCPQRDERLGWTGDAQVFAGTASFNMDTTAFYQKFIHDLRNEQVKYDGILPGVIPVLDPNGPIFSSVWGDIATFLPMVVYEHSGNIEMLRSSYPMMKDWVDKITREDQERGQKYLYDFGNQLGDWLALDGRTEQSMEGGTDAYYIGSNYYAMSVQKTAKAAEILGYEEDKRYYDDLYQKIREAIIREYFTETGRLAIDSQTGYIVALYSGIYREKEAVVAGLKARFYKDCYKLKGGFTGAPILCRVLAENGFEEDAFYFLLQEDYPGWMHCINLGATTIWERWNSVLDDGHLSGTMMNSLNHYSYGSVVEYLYRDVAGLKALEPGFKKALITPLMNGKLKYMHMTYDSAYGEYKVNWEILKNGKVTVDIQVPFGCSAVIGLPFYEGEVMEVEAGNYHYEYCPTEDLRQRYNNKTMFKDMMHDPEAMKVIERVSPMLMYFLSTGNQDYFYESIQSLEKLFYMGFTREIVDNLRTELSKLLDMEEE